MLLLKYGLTCLKINVFLQIYNYYLLVEDIMNETNLLVPFVAGALIKKSLESCNEYKNNSRHKRKQMFLKGQARLRPIVILAASQAEFPSPTRGARTSRPRKPVSATYVSNDRYRRPCANDAAALHSTYK